MQCLLVDNGSLKPASVLNLRRIAGALGQHLGREILPASLLHSSKVDPALLEGEAAVNLERRLRWSLEAGEREFLVLPFFFGPTGALTDYLPERLEFRRAKHGPFKVWRAPFLYQPGNNALLLDMLADQVRTVLRERGLRRPRVILVDHGSPKAEVTAVRDALACELGALLGDEVAAVAPASMERREGEAYAFNEPLLARKFEEPCWGEGDTVISMLFLSPGRHAGPDGDVATICREAEQRFPGLRTHMTALVGEHPGIVPLLAARFDGEWAAL
jgi:sirohydrochlorin ferrochelatase